MTTFVAQEPLTLKRQFIPSLSNAVDCFLTCCEQQLDFLLLQLSNNNKNRRLKSNTTLNYRHADSHGTDVIIGSQTVSAGPAFIDNNTFRFTLSEAHILRGATRCGLSLHYQPLPLCWWIRGFFVPRDIFLPSALPCRLADGDPHKMLHGTD